MADCFKTFEVPLRTLSVENLVEQGTDLNRSNPTRHALATTLIDTEVHKEAGKLRQLVVSSTTTVLQSP